MSPDGKLLSWLASEEGVMNIWIAPSHEPDLARPVTQDRGRGVQSYHWAANGLYLLYEQDQRGNENSHIYSVNIRTSETKDLTPYEGVRADIQAISWNHPDNILVLANIDDRSRYDVFNINVINGDIRIAYKNRQGFRAFLYDNDLRVRLAARPNRDASMTLVSLNESGDVDLFSVPFGENFEPLHFDAENEKIFATYTRGRETAALVSIHIDTGEMDVLAENSRTDINEIISHPTTFQPQAYALNYLRTEWIALDNSISGDLSFLEKQLDGEIRVVDRTRDDTYWMVMSNRGYAPPAYHVYDRASREIVATFPFRPELEAYEGARVYPVEIPSRDGLTLPSYLTLPAGSDADEDGRPDQALPLVNFVHGGPWQRWPFGFLSEGQWLANRGYAVLMVNYRGSTGFGKAFTRAGDREWGRKMQEDLLDAVKWAVQEGIADPDLIGIMGGSYGGYAVLAGLAFNPDIYACGVDICGPANLETLLRAGRRGGLEQAARLIGDPRTEEGRALLAERSPVHAAANIRKPLLIGQGSNDPRVPQSESDQMVKAMIDHDIPVTYVLFPDEGHGFVRPENDLAFYAVAEVFLAKYLGGRVEPISNDFEGSSITVPAGVEHIPGLVEALGRIEPETR